MPYRWQGIGLLNWDWWVSGAESALVSILENAKADVTCEQGFYKKRNGCGHAQVMDEVCPRWRRVLSEKPSAGGTAASNLLDNGQIEGWSICVGWERGKFRSRRE